MTQVGTNIVDAGLSRKPSILLAFHNNGGETIISKALKKKAQKSSEVQQHQLCFKEAILYAKAVIAYLGETEAYKASIREGQSNYNQMVDLCSGVSFNGKSGSYTKNSKIRL